MINGKKVQQIREWFDNTQTLLQAYNINLDSEECVFKTTLFFEDRLSTWWKNKKTRAGGHYTAGIRSFDELRTAVLAEFKGRDMDEEARDKLRTLCQKTSVADYLAEFRTLLYYLPNRDELDSLNDFVHGLKPAVRKEVALARPKSLAEATEIALEADNVVFNLHREQNRSHYRPGNSKHRDTPTPMDLGHMYAEDSEEESDPEELHFIGTQQKPYHKNRSQASEERINRLMQEGRCFTCEKKGHLSRDCPNKKKKGN